VVWPDFGRIQAKVAENFDTHWRVKAEGEGDQGGGEILDQTQPNP
jgi:hypothetical protein